MSKTVTYNNPQIKRRQNSFTEMKPKDKKEEKGFNAKEPLLENVLILRKEMNREYAKRTFYLYQKKWRIRTLILGLVTFTCGLLLIFIWKLYILAALAILAALYFIFMSVAGYLYGAGVSYRQLKDFYGDPIEMHVLFFPQFFRIQTAKGTNEFLYSQIMKRIELENMSILVVGAKGIIQHGQIIDKTAFTPTELEKYYDIMEEAGVLQD